MKPLPLIDSSKSVSLPDKAPKLGFVKRIKTQLFPFIQALNNFNLFQFLRYQIPAMYRREDAVLHLLVAFIVFSSLLIHIVNFLGPRYDISQFGLGIENLRSIPGLFVVAIIGYGLLGRYRRVGLFLITFAQIWAFFIIDFLAASSLLATPHSIIDLHLLKFDQMLGFSTTTLMQWLHEHQNFKILLTHCYDSWLPQVLLTPLLLIFLKQDKEINKFLIATFLSFIIAGVIYYFFPTIAPAGILKSPYFMDSQYSLVTRFFQIHHHQLVTAFDGGLIAFPSCHVMNALIVTYAFRKVKWLFYPVLILNSLLIFATLALGFHYLADVLAGFFIVAAILILLNVTSHYWQQTKIER